ncbi:LCP family protein [Corynebacterium sp. H78]|uniref:LCP family protein n=1 Tax=Corynebacterium sp. H78 TaxID=3133417 RepID=UPI0030ADEA3D
MSRVLKRTILAFVIVLVVFALVAGGFLLWLYNGVQTYGSSEGGKSSIEDGDNTFLLMVRDTRAGENADVMESAAESDTADGGRTDSMILVNIRAGQAIDMVSLPRDLMVSIPACETADGTTTKPSKAKINAAYAFGSRGDDADVASPYGIECAEKTVAKLTGIDVDGSAVMDAFAVKEIVDGIGGVELCVSTDQAAELEQVEAGCHVVDGDAALEYSRARKGVDDGSDLSRIERQHKLLKAVSTKLSENNDPRQSANLLLLSRKLGQHLTVDSGMRSMGNAAQVLATIRTGKLNMATTPTVWAPDGVNLVVAPEAKTWWKAMKEDQPVPMD